MKDLSITPVTIHDVAALQQIGWQTFKETFSQQNSLQDMKSYLEESFSSAKLTSELNNPSCKFYFCFLDNKLVGYMKLHVGQAQTEFQDDNALEIERIYILKPFQGKRAGQQLYEKAIRVAEQTGMQYVWLGVWERNERAIKFYKKNGFKEFDKHIFHLGADQQVDLLMKKKLTHESCE